MFFLAMDKRRIKMTRLKTGDGEDTMPSLYEILRQNNVDWNIPLRQPETGLRLGWWILRRENGITLENSFGEYANLSEYYVDAKYPTQRIYNGYVRNPKRRFQLILEAPHTVSTRSRRRGIAQKGSLYIENAEQCDRCTSPYSSKTLLYKECSFALFYHDLG
jgi:hypothetical protein